MAAGRSDAVTVVLVLGGLVLLAIGGELLVRGAVGLAVRLGVSPLLAGLTIVGFGTSTPELATSVQAAWAGSPDIAVGNVVGSNIANIALILGLSALLLPLAVRRTGYVRDAAALLGSAAAVTVFALSGSVGRIAGMMLLSGLVGYVLWAWRSERAEVSASGPDTQVGPEAGSWFPLLAMGIGGIACAIYGAQLLVEGAVILARQWGVAEAVIGLTVVAVGTSLPELVACIVAVLRKHGDIALGNVVGSNIYNILGVLGATAVIEPLSVAPAIARVDIWVMAGTTLLLALFLRIRWTLQRWEGASLLVGYCGYTAWLFAGSAA